MSTAVATVMAHPDKYEKDFNTVIAILTQYIDKRAPTPSVKVASIALLVFLNKKCNERIKGRTCANGCNQHDHIPKENEALLTEDLK